MRRNEISGCASACCCTTAAMAEDSAESDFMNFIRAGVLKKRSRTRMVVPCGQPAGCCDVTTPPSRCRLTPSASAVFVSRSMRLTDEIAARASPRKPSVPMAARSSLVRILLVAWRRNAVGASSGAMPQPLSVTRRNVIPPFWTSTVICVAPASTAFSTSSFTADAGRSTTSPAAIRSATCRSSCMICGMVRPPFRKASGPRPTSR